MNYMEIANSPILILLVLIPITLMASQAIIFLRMGMKEARNLNFPKGTVGKIVRNSAIFSVIPSLPILITLAVLITLLGTYIPWMRESLMGSAAYESFAADMAVKSLGLGSLGAAQLTPESFASIVWVMNVGGLMPSLLCLLFLKSYDKKLQAFKTKGGFLKVASGAMMMGLVATLFVPEMINFKHPIGILAGVVAGIFSLLLDFLAKKTGKNVLGEFSFPLALVIGMATAALVSAL